MSSLFEIFVSVRREIIDGTPVFIPGTVADHIQWMKVPCGDWTILKTRLLI